MKKKTIVGISVLLGIVFVAIAIMYWVTPAGSLPTFMPGYEAGVAAVHVKHGVAAFILALGVFAYAWFRSGKRPIA